MGKFTTATHYEVGFFSAAGYPVRYDKQYGSEDTARGALKHPGDHIFKVTVEVLP